MDRRKQRFVAGLVVFMLVVGAFPQAPAAGREASDHPVLAPTIVVDGAIDAAYGPPLAVDPSGDGNGNAVMDLGALYVAEDATSYYLAFTINGDIGTTGWGKYAIYIDTTGDNSGATSDAWTRNVVVGNPHRPEYGLYSWVNESPYNPSRTQFWHWTGSAWTQSGGFDEAARGVGATSVLEWRIAKSRLGNPGRLWIEAWSTGGGSSDNAQDTINDPSDDWNATDWSTTAALACSTYYSAGGILLDVTAPAEGQFYTDPEIQVTGVVSPTAGVTVTVALNGSGLYTPTIGAGGAFTQPLTLDRGRNTVTVVAFDPFESTTVVRHAYYGADHDDEVFWDGLYHDSRDSLYRTPTGPVETATPVTLRLRAYAGDLTAARLRLWNDRTNVQTMLDMAPAADDGTYAWWEVTLPASVDPTVYWYRFLAIDGADTDYYEDDAARMGGLGQPFDDSPDQGWQLTIYDPAFQTPDWVKNAVFYQIFTDRFRDGDAGNIAPAGSFFYSETSTIVRSNDPAGNWNTAVCDPRDLTSACPGVWSQNFYGGDLQGIIDKLDYLQGLGVTALYLNPVFESPSNHKYDTTDFGVIDDNFGDLALFQSLVSQASTRDIHVILDGVFNHTSSDSVFFDRYSRYDAAGNLTSPGGPGVNDGSGACESPSSPYRDWYYFTDVPAGTGTCAGSDGTPNGAVYESWFGYLSLPKLRAHNPEVRDYIWSGGESAIGRYWVAPAQGSDGWRLDVAGDVDPGVINDPTNLYWEGFRQAVHLSNPEAYIVGEEWGNASSWLLGAEWDATMNYQYSSAMLGFWRDTPFVDNDHNAGSSAGIIAPLSPSQLDERLRNWVERYPPEALHAMMNLLGSHDTNRPLFMLDHNAAIGTDDTLLDNPAYDWSDAVARLKGVVLLQMTLPGAPTIYYGDEVGNVGPVTYAGGKWEDDPYNRVPYPWLDEGGLPFYTFLQSQANQDALHDYYANLTAARLAHPALRTGSLDTLLTDDLHGVYAYGRKLADHSDAAVVIANQETASQTVTVDVVGYLSVGARLVDVMDGDAPYLVAGDGSLTVTGVPAMSGALLVLSDTIAAPPTAVTDLAVTHEGSRELTLSWSAAAGADSYDLYRSLLSGGGYNLITHTVAPSYVDSGLRNATSCYYVVVGRDDTNLLVSGFSNEAVGMPHDPIDWANLQSPAVITHTVGITPTADIYGRVTISEVTVDPGQAEGLLAQLGFGPAATPPVSWTLWLAADFSQDVGASDEFKARLTPEETGDFHYAYRYSTTGGRDWVYADQSGIISATAVVSPGLLHVLPSADSSPPAVPQNLRLIHWSAGHITTQWDPVADADLYGYDLFRYGAGQTAPEAQMVGRILTPTAIYTDETVVAGNSYTYTVRAVDRSFNKSAFSDPASGTAEPRVVELRFRVTVPGYTPAGDTIFIAGDNSDVFGSAWNPSARPLSQVGPGTWLYTASAGEGVPLQYKYTRGIWDKVESWGSLVGYENRQLAVTYGADGVMTVTDTVHNWRDPLVVAIYPPAGALDWDVGRPISATLSRQLNTSLINPTTFALTEWGGPARTGTFAFAEAQLPYSDPVFGSGNVTGTVVLLTPTIPLTTTRGYLVEMTKSGYVGTDNEGVAMQSDYQWDFGLRRAYLPVLVRQ